MFGLRSDGVKVKCADPIDKIVPHIMKERSDSMNNTVIEQRVESFDAWIDDVYRRTGVEFNYMHIVLASIVRLYALRPRLNRFVMNGRVFQRHGIYASFTVKQALKEDAPDLTRSRSALPGRRAFLKSKRRWMKPFAAPSPRTGRTALPRSRAS